MELKLVEAKKMKSLEDYFIALVTGMITIKTLQSFQEQAINLGVLKEDQECRLNSIIWDCKRLNKLYFDQAESVLELIPGDISIEKVIANLTANEISAAKKLTRKPRAKKCAT